jgi:hypothetical protein
MVSTHGLIRNVSSGSAQLEDQENKGLGSGGTRTLVPQPRERNPCQGLGTTPLIRVTLTHYSISQRKVLYLHFPGRRFERMAPFNRYVHARWMPDAHI